MLPMLPNNALEKSAFSDQLLAEFPPNMAEAIPPEELKKISQWILENYVYPQLLERLPFEQIWDESLEMYRIRLNRDKLRLGRDAISRDRAEESMATSHSDPTKSQVSDSLIFDAVDRLKNLNHFVSWKDGMPIQYTVPREFSVGKEDAYYHPLKDKIASANGLLRWNIDNQDVYRKHLIISGHHYLYGISLVLSELEYEAKLITRRKNDGSFTQRQEIAKMGITFQPISVRRVWLNYRLSTYSMEYQPCPFWVEETPRFAILQNQYDPVTNPFGFVNLNYVNDSNWLYSSTEMASAINAMTDRLTPEGSSTFSNLLKPEHSVEGIWTMMPMLPFDEQTGEFLKRADGSLVPYKRFFWQVYSNNLRGGAHTVLRFQRNFYPQDKLPLYGSCHMPELDSALYGPSIAELLANHYKELCTATNQFLDNKNWINNPPSWYVTGSPCAAADRTSPGADIPVLGPNDFGWRTPYDATGTTVGFMEYTRNMAQTTSKAVDAILGKAMGGRTSATEASNIFQAAMSGVSTDINLFNYDIMGGYAERVWEYSQWFDVDLLKAITGQYGPPLTSEDLWARVGLKWDVGSNYVESIVKQGHYRYALEAGIRSPSLRQDILWRAFFQELRLTEALPAIVDGGFEREVQKASEQAIETYMGRPVLIDPNQNHQVAMEVKIRFLEDINSRWNTEFGGLPDMQNPTLSRAQAISQQIALHQQFAMLQLQQEYAMQQAEIAAQGADKQEQNPSLRASRVEETAGQLRQSNGT